MSVPFHKNENLNKQRSIESEKALIASVLSDNDKIDDVLPIIKKDMFYNDFHALVWDKIIMLYKNGVQVDITTIKSQLQNNNSPNNTPGADIIEFFDHMTTPSHAVQYAKNVYEKSELRRLSVLVNKIQESIGSDNTETADNLSKIHNLIGNVLSIHGDDKFDLLDTIKKLELEYTESPQWGDEEYDVTVVDYKDLDDEDLCASLNLDYNQVNCIELA